MTFDEASSAPRVLLSGLGFGESPRWHDGRLWFANWGRQEIVAVDLEGKSEVILRVPTTIPFFVDWLPDGRILVVSGREGQLLGREPDSSLKSCTTYRLWQIRQMAGNGLYRRNSRLKSRLYGHSRRPKSKQNVIVKPISNHTVE